MKIAVLLTCFNRKIVTKTCLQNLFRQELPQNHELEVFLCDDGSKDGTGDLVASDFPQVKVVKGTGDLYWNGGMSLAWKTATKTGDYDFFIWLNDDTFLLDGALIYLLNDFNKIGKSAIVTAACKRKGSDDFSYGGWSGSGPIPPNGFVQKVNYINGNLVLIPSEVYKKIGYLSPSYTHYLGDFDYGLRAQKAGFDCFTTNCFLAECNPNSLPYWGDPKFPFLKRWKLLHDVKGQAIKEYVYFKIYHFGLLSGIKTWIDSYFRVLNPTIYSFAKKSLR